MTLQVHHDGGIEQKRRGAAETIEEVTFMLGSQKEKKKNSTRLDAEGMLKENTERWKQERRGERQNKEFIIALQHFQLVNIKYKEKGFSLLYFTFTCLLYVMFASVCSMLNLLAG